MSRLVKGVGKVITRNKLVTAMIPENTKIEQELALLKSCLLSTEKDHNKMLTIYGLCQRMPFFKKLSSQIMVDASLDVYLKFFERASYECCEKGTVLIKENDTLNTKAYVILKGKVGVVRQSKESVKAQLSPKSGSGVTPGFASPNGSLKTINLDSPDFQKIAHNLNVSPKQLASLASNTRKSLLFKPSLAEPSKDQDSIIKQELDNDDPELGFDKALQMRLAEYGDFVTDIKKGQMFGEVALTENVPRTASIITLENTDLMVFTRENFQHIQKYYTQEFIERTKFLKQRLPQLDEIKEKKRLTQMLQSFQPATYKRVNRN